MVLVLHYWHSFKDLRFSHSARSPSRHAGRMVELAVHDFYISSSNRLPTIVRQVAFAVAENSPERSGGGEEENGGERGGVLERLRRSSRRGDIRQSLLTNGTNGVIVEPTGPDVGATELHVPSRLFHNVALPVTVSDADESEESETADDD